MKIDLNVIDRESFHVNEHIWNGELLYLVTPKQIGVNWTKENKIFRSSVWNSNGELVSASFLKFCNWGENPEVFPTPSSLKGATVIEKLDGSTLILSKYKGQYIIRTRGTIDASKMEKNGHEIELFKETVLNPLVKLMGNDNDTWDFSILWEWTSNLNKIVLDYGDVPQFFLIGWVWHEEYKLMTQDVLDSFAKAHNLKRPETYTFTDVVDLISSVELWEGKEGVCVYHHGGQEITKAKSFQYLKLHRFKSNATFENTVDLFFEYGMPSYQEFEVKLIQTFDFECYQMVRGFISTICDGYKEVNKIIEGMKSFVNKIKSLPTRKEQAMTVFASYGKESNRSSYIFALLDGKTLEKEQLKKLLYQTTKM